MRRLLLLAVAVVLVGVAALSAVAAPGLGSSGAERRPGVVTRLWGYDNGEYGGVYGLALNDRGDAIWNWRDSPQFGKGFVWRQGRTTQLAEGVADINRRGQVVVGGVLWENGKSTVLLQGADKSPVLRSLHPYNVVAVAINDRGQVVGAVEGSNPDRKTSWQHPFLWENDTMIDLGTLGGTGAGYANAINERAQVVGDMRMLTPLPRAATNAARSSSPRTAASSSGARSSATPWSPPP